MSDFYPIIGMEIHVELKTNSKMFCRCSASYFGENPNTHVCPTCLGLPGALPYANEEAINSCIKVGLSLNCRPAAFSKFDRKNYFYPDLPKGYQISQYDLPLCQKGWIKVGNKKIGITRVHQEEDTAKLVHEDNCTLVDFNRSGVPLVEIVSEPEIESPQEAKLYCQKIQQILRFLGVSDTDMEKGSMRCEVNISLTDDVQRKKLPNYKVEIKNLNSFKAVERSLEYEIARQTKALTEGEKLVQETKGWNEAKGKTYSQRIKEEAHDYRYFPEPDLPPMRLDDRHIVKLKDALSELPDEIMARFIKKYELSEYDAGIITTDKELALWFEQAVSAYSQTRVAGTESATTPKEAKTVANWVIGEFLRQLKDAQIKIIDVKMSPADLAQLLYLLDDGQISQSIAKEVFAESFGSGQQPKNIIEEKGLNQINDDDEIEKIVRQTLLDNKPAVDDYRKGKIEVLGYLVGQVARQTKGQVDPNKVRNIIQNQLKEK